MQLLPMIIPDRSGIGILKESEPNYLQRFCFLLSRVSIKISSSEQHFLSIGFYLIRGAEVNEKQLY